MANNTLKFTNARLMAVQAVYAHAQSDEDWNKLISRFLLEEMGGNVIVGDGKEEQVRQRAEETMAREKETEYMHIVQFPHPGATLPRE